MGWLWSESVLATRRAQDEMMVKEIYESQGKVNGLVKEVPSEDRANLCPQPDPMSCRFGSQKPTRTPLSLSIRISSVATRYVAHPVRHSARCFVVSVEDGWMQS